jgi:hypothetical protein
MSTLVVVCEVSILKSISADNLAPKGGIDLH